MGSPASHSFRRMRRVSCRTGSVPSGCGASRQSARSTTSSATTRRRCSISSTSAPFHFTSGGAAPRRSNVPTGACWTWIPKDAPFSHVIEVAQATHALCDEIGLPHFVKTSGSSGLHVMIPLGCQCRYDETRSLGELLARLIVAELPGHRHHHPSGLSSGRQGLHRLPPERSRKAARCPLQRSAAAWCPSVDAAEMERGQRDPGHQELHDRKRAGTHEEAEERSTR